MREEIAIKYLARKYDEYRIELNYTKWRKEDKDVVFDRISIILGIITILIVALIIDHNKFPIPMLSFIFIEFFIMFLCVFYVSTLMKKSTYKLDKQINFYEKRMEEIKKWIYKIESWFYAC